MSDSERIKQLETQLAELKSLVVGMQNYNTITPEFRNVLNRATIGTSGKASGSENQVVNEGGAATFSVLKPPDGFDQATVNGVVHYFPYFT